MLERPSPLRAAGARMNSHNQLAVLDTEGPEAPLRICSFRETDRQPRRVAPPKFDRGRPRPVVPAPVVEGLEQLEPVVCPVMIVRRCSQRMRQKKPSTTEIVANPRRRSCRVRESTAAGVHPAVDYKIKMLSTQPPDEIAHQPAIVPARLVLAGLRRPREIERDDLVGEPALPQQLFGMWLSEDGYLGAGKTLAKRAKYWRHEHDVAKQPQLDHQNPADGLGVLSARRPEKFQQRRGGRTDAA